MNWVPTPAIRMIAEVGISGYGGRRMLTVRGTFVGAGEFEKHAGCWMGWPYDGNLWRDNAKPAQAQYAAIAKAISQFEPLTMFAHPGEVSTHLPSLFQCMQHPFLDQSRPFTHSGSRWQQKSGLVRIIMKICMCCGWCSRQK